MDSLFSSIRFSEWLRELDTIPNPLRESVSMEGMDEARLQSRSFTRISFRRVAWRKRCDDENLLFIFSEIPLQFTEAIVIPHSQRLLPLRLKFHRPLPIFKGAWETCLFRKILHYARQENKNEWIKNVNPLNTRDICVIIIMQRCVRTPQKLLHDPAKRLLH